MKVGTTAPDHGAELGGGAGAIAADVSAGLADVAVVAHTADTDDAHAASAIGFTPAGPLVSDNVQAAIEETAALAATGSPVEVLDQGVSLTAALASLDVVGGAVTATSVGDDVTLTVNQADYVSPSFGTLADVIASLIDAGLMAGPAPLIGFAPTLLGFGPVAYWRLNEDTGTTAADSGPNGLDLSVTGTVTFGQPAIIVGDGGAGSFEFDGVANDDVLNHVDAAALDLGDTLSIVIGFVPDRVNGVSALISKGGEAYLIRTNENSIEFQAAQTANIVTSSGLTMVIGDPYLLIVTKTGAAVTMEVNGVDVAGTVTNYTLIDTTFDIHVGADNSSGFISLPFKGRIAEVALFDRVLTPLERETLFSESGL